MTRQGAASHVSLLGTLIGAGFWGLSGTAAQALFQTYQFPVIALVTIRTLVSGLILFIIVRPQNREDLSAHFSVYPFLVSQVLSWPIWARSSFRTQLQQRCCSFCFCRLSLAMKR